MTDSGLSEEQVLERLQTLFRPYIGEPASLFESRQQISDFVSTVASRLDSQDQAVPIPAAITGVRLRYLEALKSSLAARRQYQESLATVNVQVGKIGSQKGTTDRKASARLLDSHLEAARQQKFNHQLNVLQRHLVQLESFSEKLGTFQAHSASQPASTVAAKNVTDAKNDLAELQRSANDIQRRLEIAVLQAQHRAQQEHNLLEGAKVSQTASSDQDKVRALCTVRDELTKWIEENLARCASAPPELGYNDTLMPADLPNVDEQYQKYISIRQRLLAALDILTRPLSSADPAVEPQLHSTKIRRPMTLLPAIESQLQPSIEDSEAITQYQQYAEEQLTTEKEDTLGELHRLRDESQLLEAYPMLAKSSRFQHAAAVFGNKETSQKDQVLEQVEAWSFAANAASNAAETAMTANLQSATTTLSKVDEEVQKFETFDRVFRSAR